MFDRDLPLDVRDHLFETLEHDPGAAHEAARTQRVLSLLAGPVPGPDLSSPILDRLERSGVIVSRRTRRSVTMWRAAAVVALGGAAVTIAMIQRTAPDAVGIRSPGAPLAGVADAGEQVGASAAGAIGSVVARVSNERSSERVSERKSIVPPERAVLASRLPADRLVRTIDVDRSLATPSGTGSAPIPPDWRIERAAGAPLAWAAPTPDSWTPVLSTSSPSAVPPVDLSVEPQLMPVLGQVGGVWFSADDAWRHGILRPRSEAPRR
jgi:hypothetical protein